MSNRLGNVLLAVIAVSLLAIVAKLYCPVAQSVGPRLYGPVRGDLVALRQVEDKELRAEERKRIYEEMPIVWVSGGSIDVDGGYIEVTGSVQIDR